MGLIEALGHADSAWLSWSGCDRGVLDVHAVPPNCLLPLCSSRYRSAEPECVALLHVVVQLPDLRGAWWARRSNRVEGRHQALLSESPCILVRLKHFYDTPAAVWARPGCVKDAARRPFQPNLRPNLLVDLLSAFRIVHHDCNGHAGPLSVGLVPGILRSLGSEVAREGAST